MGTQKTKSLESRFFEKVSKSPTTGCWEWTGGKCYGYGIIHVNDGYKRNRSKRAHRVSYEIHVGPIAGDMDVCHKCDNPSCVNPDHLFLGTTKDNADDRDRKKRHWVPNGESSPHSKITEDTVKKIRAEFIPSWGGYSRLARKYGLAPEHVRKIINNKIWRNV